MKKCSTGLLAKIIRDSLICLSILLVFSCTVDLLHLNGDPPQQPPTNWSKAYGAIQDENANKILYLPGQGSVLIGTSGSFSRGGSALIVTRLDLYGKIVWQKYFGLKPDNLLSYEANNKNIGIDICKVSSGGFVLTGITKSCGDINFGDMLVIRLDDNGNRIWQRSFGSVGGVSGYANNVLWAEMPYVIKETSDKGFIIGSTIDFGRATYNYFALTKITQDGTIEWQKKYGRNTSGLSECLTSLATTIDGGYIVAGKLLYSNYTSDAMLLKIDSTGAITWQKTYGGAGNDQANTVIQTAEGGYLVGGSTTSFGEGKSDGWVLKLTNIGEISWASTFGGAADDEEIVGVQEGKNATTNTPEFIFLGHTNPYTTGSQDLFVIKLNIYLAMDWQYLYGGSEADWAADIQAKGDNSYLIAGTTNSTDHSKLGLGGTECWVFNIDTNGDSEQPHTLAAFKAHDVKVNTTVTTGTYTASDTSLNTVDVVDATFKVCWDITTLTTLDIPWQKQ